jgi:endonuclease/exonuclease/phosphatase family metal-dependent hydrolase
MAKALSVASWNVEHFKKDPTDARVKRVVAFLEDQKPDVFALYEVEGKEVFDELTALMSKYAFFITEGPQVQEILVGVKGSLSAFFTQRVEFRSGVSLLRPGALLTVTVAGESYALLFLHVASGVDPRGLGLRDDMLQRACDFRRALDAAPASNGRANYVFLGDLNLMGMTYTFVRDRDISGANELDRLDHVARRRAMRILVKDEPATWSNGSASSIPPSNLDFVVAADHLKFKNFSGAEVTVRGWPKLSTVAQQDAWIRDFSDHGLLYFEVQRV